jgi:hypothetical protein
MVALLFVRRVIGKDHHLIEIDTKSTPDDVTAQASEETPQGKGHLKCTRV